MHSAKLKVLLVSMAFLDPAIAWAGACDFVLRWDEQAIGSCFKELKSEVSSLRMQLENERLENGILRGNLCLLAMDMKTESAASVASDACAALKARAAAKKKAMPSLSNRP